MNITQIQGAFRPEQMIKRTDDDMRREFAYIAAGQITQKLLDKGLSPPANSTRSWRKTAKNSRRQSQRLCPE